MTGADHISGNNVRENESGSGPDAGSAAPADAAGARKNAAIEIRGLEDCLFFLAHYFDLNASETSIRSGFAGFEAHISPEQFIQSATKIGLSSAVGNYDLENLRAEMLPVVLLMRDAPALVICEKMEDGTFAVFEPGTGPAPAVRALHDIRHGYAGALIAVRPEKRTASEGIVSIEETRRNHWFFGPLLENRKLYTQVLMAAAMTNVLSLVVSVFSMVVYDRVLPNEAFDSLMALTFGVCLALGFDLAIKLLRGSFIDTAGQRADLRMGVLIFDHLLDMQMRSRKGSSGAFANVLREFETLRDFFTSATLVALVDVPFILLFVFIIYLFGGPLAVIPALAVPAVLVMGYLIQPFLTRYAEQLYAEGKNKQGVLVETISGLETIKTAGAGPLMRKRWEESIRFQSGVGAKSRRIAQFAVNATSYLQQMAQVGVIFYGVYLISAGQLSMGALIACVMLISRTMAPLSQLAQTMTRVSQVRASYENLNKLMHEPTERRQDRRYISRPRLDGRIECRDVSFAYPDQMADALRKVSFTIQPGEKVAILGRIGSGKSTLMRLLLGLYEPDQGSILIDNTDIRQIDPADLRRNVAAVLQDVWLFSGSVRQNIAIGARRPTDADILHAATVAGVHDFVSQHPEGYGLVLSERGEGLSGGQKQSIALARAVIAKSPVLVMDEPTSMMDMHSEQLFLQRLKAEIGDKTLVVITHRTSLLELVDRVIVLDQGRVVADGPKAILQGVNPGAAANQTANQAANQTAGPGAGDGEGAPARKAASHRTGGAV